MKGGLYEKKSIIDPNTIDVSDGRLLFWDGSNSSRWDNEEINVSGAILYLH